MMNIALLKAEITDDSLSRGYANLSDEAVANDLNTVYRTVPRTSISTMEMFARFDDGEYKTQVLDAADAKKSTAIGHLLSMGTIDPSNVVVQKLVTNVFGAGSATLKNLSGAATGAFPDDDLRVIKVSRGVELNLGLVRPGNVTEARI